MNKTLMHLVRYQVRQGFPLGLVILAKFRKKTGLINVKPAKVKFPFWLRAGTSDVPTFDEIFVAKQYDLDYENGFVPKTIVDCGANIGLGTIYFKNKFPNAKIISIEPESSNFSMLEMNVAPYDNIQCVNAGVWNRETNLKGSDKYGTDKWTFSVEEMTAEDVDLSNQMPSVSIDGIMKRYGLETIDLLKIDIEGAEIELFSENVENWLPKTKCIVIELHDRLRKGTGTAFFKATSRYDFSYYQKGVSTYCINNKL